jgi:outer membrane protein assembly factor BamB
MTRLHTLATRCAVVLLLLSLSAARSGETNFVSFNGESKATALRLSEAGKLLDAKKWDEAVEQLQSILTSAGNDLVPITPAHRIQARRLCQIRLSTLPPEILRNYRQRHEAQARKKLEQAQASRDTELLRRVVEEAFVTRAAEKAIDQLGDLAFERGRFDEAEEWWRLLAPLPEPRRDAASRGLQLVYPDPTLDPARLQAKQLLARVFGRTDGAGPEELDAFAQRYGKVEGTLAGRKGRYADVLHALAEERKKEKTFSEADWTTFGGDPSRGKVIPAPDDLLDRLSALCRSGPTWRFNLQDHSRQDEPSFDPAINAAQSRTLAFHPVVIGHEVLLADARYVTGYDLRTGRASVWYDIAGLNGGVQPNLKLPAPPDLRYTLSVADDHVYVRLGEQDIGLDAGNPRREKETFLACLSLKPDADGERARWTVRGVTRDGSLWEGAPLAAGGLIWCASTRYKNARAIAAIDCFPADDTSQPPARWRRDVCQIDHPRPGERRFRHELLTLAGTQIVYCTHHRAVVAVDALSGRTNWGIRYPGRGIEKDEVAPPDGPAWKDLAPVLFAAGRLYVAPADSDHLLCLDPATGRTLWEREAIKVVHLLGVGRGRLIFTTDDGLRAVDASDGRDIWAVPDQGGGLVPAGRGLLIGDLVLWPTVRKRGDVAAEGVVYAVRQEDGRLADDPTLLHRLPAGNLAYANGCLAVADRRTLSVFVPPRLLLRQREAEARAQPDSAAALLEQARAEADAGLIARAVRTFRFAEERANRLSDSRRKKMLDAIRRAQQQALLEAARRAARARHWDEASSSLQRAAEVPLEPRGRLHALTCAARIWENAGRTDAALQVWQTIRADETLRSIALSDEHDLPVAAATAADSAIARLRGEQPAPPAQPSAAHTVNPPVSPPLPLFRSWHVSLAADEWVLNGKPAEAAEIVTGTSRGDLLCRRAASGELLWRRLLPFVPRWSGAHGNTILAAGEQGVACLHRGDGELVWKFSAPVGGRGSMNDRQAPEPLTAFHIAAGRLFFLQGQRFFFALNAETGAVLWRQPAADTGFGLPYPRGHFSPCYHAGAETVLVQMPGRTWLLEAASGRKLHQDVAPTEPWTQPPLELDPRALCVAFDRGHVGLIDARTGRRLWTYALPGGTTPSGELPQVLGRDQLLLLAIPTNIGYFLQHLDRASGKPLWPRPRLLAMRTLDVMTWAFDSEAVYLAEDQTLKALSLADGRVLWEQPLTDTGGWQVRRGDEYLLVYRIPLVPEATFRFRSPLGNVQWNWSPSLAPERIFAVQCREVKTGRLVQCLNLRIESPARTSAQRKKEGQGGRSLVLHSSALLATESGPVVQLAASVSFVAAGREVWGLYSADQDKHAAARTER